MAKQSYEKQNTKSINVIKLNENRLTDPSKNLCVMKSTKKSYKNKEMFQIKPELIKKEYQVPDIENVENYSFFDKISENIENINEKTQKVKKKYHTKLIKEPDEKKTNFMSNFGQIKLSQTVIVDSVIKVTTVDPKIEALLPESLSIIYNRFINSKKYVESLQHKDDFFCGIGLLGVNVEEKIYNKRKALEDSLKRGIRLRPNPKPTKLFDGTIINRPARNCNNGNKTLKSASRPIVLRGKTKYNLFNIGIDTSKKKNRRPIRKPIKKKIVGNKAIVQKSDLKKENANQNSASSDEEMEDKSSKSIAFTRPKRLQKMPKLDFKYCYADRMTGRKCKYADSNSDGAKSNEFGRDYMEIVDSDSSSVVEVSPPNDIDLSDESDGQTSNTKEIDKARKNRHVLNTRRGWRPKESKALNLLDKLRLGLQCTIIQTEHDIIIQNLSLDDLATLQSRLQGLATFKNIEAEYDKNGQETARATIDRKLLNLPLKTANDGNIDNNKSNSGSSSNHRKYEDSLKRKLISSQLVKYQAERKKTSLQDKTIDDLSKSSKNYAQHTGVIHKQEDCQSAWIRPKGRSVKKVRKLYTQSGSTPNILSRCQMTNRPDNLMSSSTRNATSQALAVSKNQSLTFSTANDSSGYNQHSTSVSFYSQLNTLGGAIVAPIPIMAKPIATESVKSVSTISSTNVAVVPVANIDLTTTITTTPNSESGNVFSTSSNIIINNNTTISSTTIGLPSSATMITTLSTTQSSSSPQTPTTSQMTCATPFVDLARKAITIEKIVPVSRMIDLVSPATAMSASQLLMLKRGGAQQTNNNNNNDNNNAGSTTNNVAVTGGNNNTDQLYANQILKPFKKTFITSSPPKLELDDEETEVDFELTPSMITQVKNVPISINLSNSQNIHNKNNFISKPLIQSSGILPNSRKTISLTNTPLFQAQNALNNSPIHIPTCCITLNTKPITVIDKPIVCVVTSQSISLPNTSISSTANNNTNNISNNQNTSPNQNTNVKIKPRKWTHNFHTSNSINFREVLCSSRSNNVLLNLSSQIQLPNCNSISTNSITNVKQIPIPPNTIATNTVIATRTPEKANQTPSKGSSAVLKSLLVGTNTSNDLCNLNKSSSWASKYLSTSTLQDSSKIKWQVGGTVVASLQSHISTVSKESTPLEVANTNNNK